MGAKAYHNAPILHNLTLSCHLSKVSITTALEIKSLIEPN